MTLPASVAGSGVAIGLAAGGAHTCAILGGGGVRCWGANDHGQLGAPTSPDGSDSSTPIAVMGIADATQVTCGEAHTCVRRKGGQISCWGDGTFAQAGVGTAASTPFPPTDTGQTGIAAVACGARRTCARRSAGTIGCWGFDGMGADDMMGTKVLAVMDLAGATNAVAIGSGAFHVCAVVAAGAVRCAGRNDEGQLGIGVSGAGTGTPDAQLASGLVGATTVRAGGNHTCALRANGSVACWGDSSSGEVGDGSTGAGAVVDVPTNVAGVVGALSIAAGAHHTCAVASASKTTCWGNNDAGQLGNGSTMASATPNPVTF